MNGGIDATNLASNAVTTAKITAANVTDAKLASPNNSAYKGIANAATAFTAAGAGITGTYVATAIGAYVSGVGNNNAYPSPLILLTAGDYTVAGLTTRLRLVSTLTSNVVSPGGNTFTAGLYPVSSSAGGTSTQTLTLGTVVAGSTVAFTSVGASASTSGNSGDFAVPATGTYVFGVALSVAAVAGNSYVGISFQLQYRHT